MNLTQENSNSFFLIIEKLKIEFLQQLCELIEHQILSNNFGKNIVALEEAQTHLAQEVFQSTKKQNIDFEQNNKMTHFNNIDDVLKILHKHQNKNNLSNIVNLRNNLFNLNRVFNRLFEEHDLLYRQTEFLKSLINSYSNFSNLEQSTQILLRNFYYYFPCYVIAICIENEKDNIIFQMYYMGYFSEQQKIRIKDKLKDVVQKQHGVTFKNIEIFEKILIQTNVASNVSLNEDNLVAISFKTNKDFESTRVLSIICSAQKKMTSYARHVMGTNLYIMGINLNTNVHLLSDAFLKIKHYATHDVLTGLYNRRYFDSIINHEINRSIHNNSKFCMLMIDLDNFKTINDSYGHAVGDMVIKNVSNIILKSIRKADIASRIGGDEFAVVLTDIELAPAMLVAEKIRKEVQSMNLFGTKGDLFHTSVSIGVTSYPNSSSDAVELMSVVDAALYKAKDLGRNTVFLSDNPKNRVDTANYEINYLEKIRVAMEEGRAIPYFQPIVHNATEEIYGYEVLARVKDVNNEIIIADKFIKLVEKSIFSYDFHKMIIYKSLQIFKQKLQKPSNPIKLFINLSVTEIQNKKILEDIHIMCKELDISSEHIVFEFVERDVINDMYFMQTEMDKARKNGFSFAVDDFGSAYNSLSYLREMSFEYLKIEGAFIKNILNSKKDYILVKHIQSLCQELGITVIAEFVESQEILEKLREINVPYGQGFYLGMPKDLAD